MAITQNPDLATIESAPEFDNPFENGLTRRHFIMKVYGLLCVCICVTVAHVIAVLYSAPFRNFLFRHYWILWVAVLVYTVTSFIIACCMPVMRNRAAGLILLIMLVESLSIICATTTMFYETKIILAAAFGTALLCYLVTVVAIFMPIDLTNCTFVLTVLGILLILVVTISIIVGFFAFVPLLQLVAAFVCVIVFAIYMVYATQLILGGKTYEYSEEDYLAAAIFLYIYVVIIFMNFLQIFDYFCQ